MSLTGSSSVIGLALAYGAIAIQSGANFLVVSSLSMAGRREHACLAALGVATGAAFIAGLAFCGTQQLEAVTRQLWMLQLLYAAILAKIGIDALQRACHRTDQDGTPPVSRSGCFRTGFLTAATNPVTIVFLVGLATGPTAIGGRRDPSSATLTIFVVALAWFSVVALLFSVSRVRAAYGRARPWANLAMGLLLLAMAFDITVKTSQSLRSGPNDGRPLSDVEGGSFSGPRTSGLPFF